jgi:4-methyl-5(b-hydroxyethyl)-thiazole monophosphate biosynthesis
MEAVITINVLRRAGADVTVASVEKQLLVDAGHGVKIVADTLVSDCADGVFDLITLPVRFCPLSVCVRVCVGVFVD